VPAGGEWIGWRCIEADQALFEIVLTVPISWAQRKAHQGGRARSALPAELIESCEPGSVRVVSVMGQRGSMLATGCIQDRQNKSTLLVIAAAALGASTPGAARVQLAGVRRGHGDRWPRFTEQQAAANELFYGTATQLSP